MAGLTKDDPRRDLRKRRAMPDLSDLQRLDAKAVRVLERNLDQTDDGALSQRAAETVLAYTRGKPRQQTDVTHTIVNAAQAHFDALTAINAAKHDLDLTANQLISLDDLTPRDKLSINHAPTIEGELIPLPPKSDDKSIG